MNAAVSWYVMPCSLVEMIRLHYYQISQMLICILTPFNLVTNSQDSIRVQQNIKIIHSSLQHSEYQSTACLVSRTDCIF